MFWRWNTTTWTPALLQVKHNYMYLHYCCSGVKHNYMNTCSCTVVLKVKNNYMNTCSCTVVSPETNYMNTCITVVLFQVKNNSTCRPVHYCCVWTFRTTLHEHLHYCFHLENNSTWTGVTVVLEENNSTWTGVHVVVFHLQNNSNATCSYCCSGPWNTEHEHL